MTRRDCAAAAAAVLLHAERYENACFDITGPSACSHGELADLVSGMTGKSVCYVDLPAAQFKTRLLHSGIPELFTPFFVGFDLAAGRGALDKITNSVWKLTGRPAEDIREVLKGCLQ